MAVVSLAKTLLASSSLGLWAVGSALSIDDVGVSAPRVTVRNGSYVGSYSRGYQQDFFLGMPYAQKAVRFSLAEPLNQTWEGTRDATAYPPHCIGYGGDDVGYELSEDCLYLNVIRPAGVGVTAGLPVAVWIHGGGLFMGGSADRRYNLSFLVQNSVKQGTPMIGISLNYRLSAFGFLCGREALEAGLTNIGFHDQRLALHWIHENIASFGGAADKVTIFGESSGAESMSAQVLAYNGRDDSLFRAVIAESGFGGFIGRYPGGLNATAAQQATFDALVGNTSCASQVGRVTVATTTNTIDCLRSLPLAELNAVLNNTASPSAPGPWPPVLDGDFVADHPSSQLAAGHFVRVPVLIGTNTDEGSAFGTGKGPGGKGVDTDAEMAVAIRGILGPASTGEEEEEEEGVDALVADLMALYPDIQAVGIPGLDKFPAILPGDSVAQSSGLMYRRTGALFGDYAMHYSRRRANLAWSAYGVPSWSYRFDVVVNGIPAFVGVTHFQEVAFVFCNLAGDGYATNPFANESASYPALARTMSSAWINFVTGLDPNGKKGLGLPGGVEWPVYNASAGGGVGENLVWSVNGSYVEWDSYRAEGINWMMENALAVFGS